MLTYYSLCIFLKLSFEAFFHMMAWSDMTPYIKIDLHVVHVPLVVNIYFIGYVITSISTLAGLAFCRFSSIRFINSNIHEHLCKLLYTRDVQI